MLEIENAFYKAHRDEFREKYPDKQLVITGESLFGVYGTLEEAAKAALKYLEPGKFMIHSPANDGVVLEIGPIIHARYPDDKKKLKARPVMTYA